MGKKCCGKAAEGHSCGCGTMNADTATVQEPDWIPDGDGRAIGQQDFAINLSPLHAEHEQGYDDRDDESIGERHRGSHSQSMKSRRDESKGMTDSLNPHHPYSDVSTMSADMVGSPSPTFNEDITGQDGPSDTPTNATFEARDMHKAPNLEDVENARRALIPKYALDKDAIIYDKYMVNQQVNNKGKKQNRFYYTAITEKNGRFYAMGAHGGIGARNITPYNIYGRKENAMAYFSSLSPALQYVRDKEEAKLNRRPSWKEYRVVTYSELAAEDTLAEIEGPTAEATSGGLHSPSSFAMTWEDGMGQSSASIPPNEIAWAEDVKGSESFVMGSIYAVGLATIGLIALIKYGSNKEQKAADNLKNAINKRKGCGCGNKSASVRKDSEFSVGQINPVEVEGQSDIYGAEDYRLSTPQVSQPNWGPQKTYRQNQRRNLKMW